MPWGFVAGAAIGAIGSVVAGGEQASGQQAAANTQRDMFNTIVQQEQPFLQGGYGAESALLGGLGLPAGTPGGGYGSSGSVPLNQLVNLGGGMGYGIGGSGVMIPNPSGSTGAPTAGLPPGYFTQQFNPTQQQLEQYPGYQFQLQQGNLALQSANSAGGSAISGPALKSLMDYNQGLAASNYNNYFNQFQTQQNNIFNRLNAIATMGQNAAANLGTSGTQLGTGIAQAQAGAAGSIAGGIAGASNNIGNAVQLAGLMNSNPGGYGTGNSNTTGYAGGGTTIDAGGGYNFSWGGS